MAAVVVSKANRAFDPDHVGEDFIQECSIPPFQGDPNTYVPPNGGELCPPSITGGSSGSGKTLSLSDLSEDEIHLLAEAYAPVLLFHPLEQHFLQSVDETFAVPSNGKIYRQQKQPPEKTNPIVIDDHLNLETLLLVSKPDIMTDGRDVFFEHIETEEYQRGAGFDYTTSSSGDRVGLSRASIYYSVLENEPGGTWVFNYYFYYTWNRAQTFGFGVGNNQHLVLEMTPYGTHDGDWESMEVMVCPQRPATSATTLSSSYLQPLAVQYQQHGFSQITDCSTKGECIFWKDTNHPVGFVALGSHATFPLVSRTIVYAIYPFHLFVVWPAFFMFVDQTIYQNADTGEYKMFFPTKHNLVQHKQPEEINFMDSGTPMSDYWQAYAGRWGSSRTGKARGPDRPNRCFNYDQNRVVKCPTQIPLVQSILDFLGSSAMQSIACLIPELNAFLQRDLAPYGPPLKRYFDRWAAPRNANIWSCTVAFTDEADFCNRLGTSIMKGNQDDYEEGLGALALSMTLTGVTYLANSVGFVVSLFGG